MRLLNSDSCGVEAEPTGAPEADGHRREALAYAETVAREDAAADARLLVASPTYSEGCLVRRQAS